MKALLFSLCLLVASVAPAADVAPLFETRGAADDSYGSIVISVGTSAVEVKIGASRNPTRQRILIYNDSSSLIYYGPSGVTVSGSNRGIPIFKKQIVVIPAGDIGVYLIAGSASNDAIVQVME